MPNTPSAVVGGNIKAEMARKSISQMTVAAFLGKSQAAVSARLRGLTPVDVNELIALAEFFDIPVSALMAGIDTPAGAR